LHDAFAALAIGLEESEFGGGHGVFSSDRKDASIVTPRLAGAGRRASLHPKGDLCGADGVS
ncbi:hypothetical protein NLR28_26730, partial [Escherichia coli]|nr:hypothetical protein [Escherichia coli]